jgi:hypothetical protein
LSKEETSIGPIRDKELPSLSIPKAIEKEEPPQLSGFGASEMWVWKAALWWFLALISILSISMPAIYVAKGLHHLDLSAAELGAYGGVVLGGKDYWHLPLNIF